MAVAVEILGNGGLYCDISLPALGYSEFSSGHSLPIVMDAGFWDGIAAQFIATARASCPVDTGYLQAHNDARADDGGVEAWSEAEYSVYQEYGTSKMPAHPWFESAARGAAASAEAAIGARVAAVNNIDAQLSSVSGVLGTIQESVDIPPIVGMIQGLIGEINSVSGGMPGAYRGIYVSVISSLENIIGRLWATYEKLFEQEAQKKQIMAEAEAGGNPLGAVLKLLLTSMLLALLEVIQLTISDALGLANDLNAISGGGGSIHARTR